MQRKRAGANERQRREIEDEGPQAHRALLNTVLTFWCVCGAARCRRARACRGDAEACFRRYWPMVPEEFKVSFRAMIKASIAGHTPQEIDSIAEAEVARWRELTARLGALAAADHAQAAPDAHSDAQLGSDESAAASLPPNPRLRSV